MPEQAKNEESDITGLDGIDLEELESLEASGEKTSLSLVGKLYYYHPLILLALSGLSALAAYMMWPKDIKVEKPPLIELYKSGWNSLRQVADPQTPLSPQEQLKKVMQARADFELMFLHYNRQLEGRHDLINPYMLLADTTRMSADRISLRRAERLSDAAWAYERAIAWETRPRTPTQQATYDRQYPHSGPADATPDAAELKVRQTRRGRYLRFHQALCALESGQNHLALTTLEELDKDFRREEIELAGQTGSPLAGALTPLADLSTGRREYLPREFELSREDRLLTNYHLAVVYEKSGQIDQAERQYRFFLLNSPRQREKFLSLLQLGGIYMGRGRRELAAAGDPGEAGAGEASRRARRYFTAASDMYNQAIAGSAPEDLLRTAYFEGGRALLAIAENFSAGRDTWWDTLDSAGRGLADVLRNFSGRQFPAPTARLPLAAGKLLLGQSLPLPDPLGTGLLGLPGAALTLGGQERQTQRTARVALLDQARVYFEGAQGGADARYNAAARVMIARTLLAEGRPENARNLFLHTLTAYPDAQIMTACRHGIGESYLREGDLERAKLNFLGGVELQDSYLLNEEDVAEWRPLCRRLVKDGESDKPGPARRVWGFFPAEARTAARNVMESAIASPQNQALLLAGLNNVLRRRDFYWPKDFGDLELPEAARELLGRDLEVMGEADLQRLNRLLLETAFPSETVRMRAPPRIPGLPAADKFTGGELINVDLVVHSLNDLSRAYLHQADEARREAGEAETLLAGEETSGSNLARSRKRALTELRKSLEAANEVIDYLLAKYRPGDANLIMQGAELCERRSEVLAGFPFYQPDNARNLTAQAARTYLEVSAHAPGSPAEEESLWRAGRNFYSAENFERAVEAFTLFVDKYSASDRAGEATNLLGRSYRQLGLFNEAIGVFARNSQRRTPDGRKALYYLGAAYLAVGQLDGKDRLGSPRTPLPEVDEDGVFRCETALQAFNHLRRLPGISWESRPWRWATFGLGLTWLRIAERDRQAQPDQPGLWTPSYHEAEDVLRESLHRYLLRDASSDRTAPTEPEDYREIQRARLVSQYYLARAQLRLDEPEAARKQLTEILDAEVYPDSLFDDVANPTERREGLGFDEGPMYPTPLLVHLRRNAFFLLGRSLFQLGDDLSAQGPENRDKSAAAYREAYKVYQLAHDRLPPRDAPAVIYQMAECLRKLGLDSEAETKYLLAKNAAKQLKLDEEAPLTYLQPDFWEQLASQRHQDLQDRF